MKSYVLHDAAGTIRAAIEAGHLSQLAAHALVEPGDIWTETPFPPWAYEIAVEDGAFVPVLRATDPAIALAQSSATSSVAASDQLTQVLACGYTASIGLVQCDATAQRNIEDRLQAALLARHDESEWSERWRLTDNSWSAEMDATGMIAFAAEVKAYVQACRVACWAVKDAIRAAATPDQIAAIDITAGYPAPRA